MLTMRNNTTYIKRDLMAEIIALTFKGTLEKEIDALPPRFYPRKKETVRCCIYKDRAMIRYRTLAILGFALEEDDDDSRPLRDYAKEALDKAQVGCDHSTPLTMLDMVCSSCAGGKYNVTDFCQGCVARPCQVNCPKDAITILKGVAVIDEKKCVNCGKCQKLCPYNAIVYTPLPCSDNCPVDAIELGSEGERVINYDKCVSCGNCTRSCPFGAVVERSHIIPITTALMSPKEVIALVAPSLFAQFPGEPGKLVGALKKIGFSSVVEVASGAEETARLEALELKEMRETSQLPMTNSCCPAWKETVEKHIPILQDRISHTASPMEITGTLVKEHFPQSVTVFIGPCIAKKNEARQLNCIDYTMTFEELGAFLLAQKIEIAECSDEQALSAPGGPKAQWTGRSFARNGGVASALESYFDGDVKIEKIDGLDRKKILQLKKSDKFYGDRDFLEVMCCEGGCLGGPGVISPIKAAQVRLDKFLERE